MIIIITMSMIRMKKDINLAEMQKTVCLRP